MKYNPANLNLENYPIFKQMVIDQLNEMDNIYYSESITDKEIQIANILNGYS